MIKTIFFDIYQTLIDVDIEQKQIHEAWNLFDEYLMSVSKITVKTRFEELVKIQDDRFYENKNRQVVHRDIKESINEVFNHHYHLKVSDKEIDKLIWEFRTKSRSYFNLYADVHATLEILSRNYVLAVASISHASYTIRELKELGIDKYFSHFILSSIAGYRKPSKEFFRYAINQVNSKPEECIMIGDNLFQDISGAQKMNLWTILIENPITLKHDLQIKPDEVVSIANFKMIIGAINNIERKIKSAE